MTLSERYIAELECANRMREAITGTLSGRAEPVLFDYAPSSRYCIGVLTPPTSDATDDGRAARRSRRKPDALGFSARVEPEHCVISGHISLRFALYYRELPLFTEQRPDEGEVDIGGKQRLRQKFRREVVTITGLPFSVEVPLDGAVQTIDFSAANASIGECLRKVANGIAAAPGCWPGAADYTIQRAALITPEAYEGAIPKTPPQLPTWAIFLDGRLVGTGDGWRLSVLTQNRSQQTSTQRSQHPTEVFDVVLEVTLQRGAFVSEQFAAAALDYRYETKSWGSGVNAVLEVTDNGKRAHTEVLPVYEQTRTRSKGISTACASRTLAGPDTLAALQEIGRQLDGYSTSWEEANKAFAGDSTATNREEGLIQYRAEITRFRLGIQALERDPRLLEAFRLANRAAFNRSEPLEEWRLFQIVYMVMILPSLLAREHPNDANLRSELETVDVLWFPTGGGKTEAYFGVILIAMFYDRLRGKRRGTTAWIRYPLRMLSIQQLQRLTDFVVSAEHVREAALTLGSGDSFTVGYYVGSSNTPNELTHARSPHPIQRLAQEAASNQGDAARLHTLQWCPYCRAPKPRTEVDDEVPVLRIVHRCANPSCRRVAPIYISDSEIYRYAPTVLVGTVDRLARAGQTDLFSHIFGQFDSVCPQHGYASFDRCVEAACTCKPRTFESVASVYDPAPALLLQDELHLLKESLGTYDAHFEGFLDVAAKHLGNGLPPKRLAATATIEGYEKHVYELYGRRARRFPVKGREEFDSAYVASNHGSPVSRLYLGVLPFGIDSDEVAARIAEVVKAEAERYWATPDCDPALAGRYDLSLIYVNQKNTAGNIGARLNNQMEVLSLTGDRSLDEVREAIDRIVQDEKLQFPDRLKTLIATSLISHGVDLSRLNVMAFVGFPGRAADYIQSSSRVGRDNIGLVCTIFDPNSSLDRSTYLHFHEYHDRLYQLVQPVPINRFSEASVARTFSGIYSALVLNVIGPEKRRAGQIKAPLSKASSYLQALEQSRVTDDELIALIIESYGIEQHGLPTEVLEKLRKLIVRKVQFARKNVEAGEDYMTYRRLKPPPVSSLRDVQEQVEFKIDYRKREELDRLRGY